MRKLKSKREREKKGEEGPELKPHNLELLNFFNEFEYINIVR